jgi:hypothetical protein
MSKIFVILEGSVLNAKFSCTMKWFFILLILFVFSCSEKKSVEVKKFVATEKPVNELVVKQKKEHKDSIVNKECYHNDLSYAFNFKIKFIRIVNIGDYHDSCLGQIYVEDKKSHKKVDSISLNRLDFFGNFLGNCDNVRSYTTGKNMHLLVEDNNCGDIVVADFNFDSKDDIAIINDFGGNGGPLYSYYIQDKNEHFCLDSFLTEKMIFFPVKINKKNKTLVTIVHANAREMCERTFRYNTSARNWKEIRKRWLQY